MSMVTDTFKRMESDAERDVRQIAKEYGVKVRRNPINGIDVKFADGQKKRYLGWFELQNALIVGFDLAD